MKQQTRVDFCVRLLDGADDVAVLGSAPELGGWDVQRAVPMARVQQHDGESEWRASVALGSAGAIEYKYVVRDKQSGVLRSWEGLPGNRTLTVAPGTNVARGAKASQISTYETQRAPRPGKREASLGNNGNTNGFQEWRCCRTNKESNPWWEVDLGEEYNISSIHLWNALTYHEQARHPEGRPPITSKASTSVPEPPLWVFVSKEPLAKGENALNEAQAKAQQDAAVRAIEMDKCNDSRVRSINFVVPESENGGKSPDTVDSAVVPAGFAPVKGRYVRLQYASASSALQFAELEVFTQDPVVSVDGNESPKNLSCITHDDGFYGVSDALSADLQEYVESGWLNPAVDTAEVQFWIGNFNSTKPAIQWLGGEPEHNRVAIQLRHERQLEDTSQEPQDAVKWESAPVESKGAALLDKDSTELRQLLENYQQRDQADLSGYLNNDPGEPQSSKASSWIAKLAFTRSLNASKVEALAGKVGKQTYRKGDSILSYAEQKRAVFYIKSGDVELFGPESSRGSHLIGSVGSGTFFNEMGLFGRWSKQPALFKAKTDVTCYLLEFETLLSVLGSAAVSDLRGDIIRKRHQALKSIETSKASVVHCTDSTHAQVFRVKAPVSTVDGTGSHSNSLSHRWIFDIYDCELEATTGACSRNKLLGSSYLLPSQLGTHGEADITVPIFSTGSGIVGQLTLSYLVLTPFDHPKNNIANVWRSYWRERPPLTIGHRGMGRSYYQVDGYRLALTRENTLASFILAGRSGADFVEFDVQLTKDRVPVIYHDFLVNVGLQDKHAESFGTKPETYEIGIHDMTFRQLTQSYTAPVPHKGGKSQVLQSRLKKHWARLQGDKQVLSPRREPLARSSEEHSNDEEDHLVDFFPRLEDLLKHVPAEVGLNIEIKYPDPFFRATMRSSSQFAINAYLDKVLQCVFDHAGTRRIFFSCFDPSVCIALRAKQAKYPVLFLTYGSIAPNAMDARMTLQFATNLAKMEKLQGIVSNSNAFLETPELAPLVKKDMQSVLITWGDQNTNHEMVQLQKRHAVDGVISDNVIDLINQDKKLRAQLK